MEMQRDKIMAGFQSGETVVVWVVDLSNFVNDRGSANVLAEA
jgi:hypothetical protein